MLIINISSYETFNSESDLIKKYLERYLYKESLRNNSKEENYKCINFDKKKHDSLMKSLNESIVYNIKF